MASRSGILVGSIPGGEVFNVLDGPFCADGLNWWLIEYGELIGWTVEGSGVEYWVEPYEATAPESTEEPTLAPTTAPAPEPVSRFEPPIAAMNTLEVGGQARVINDDPTSDTITLTVRAEPGRDGAPLAQALEGDLLTIVGGPEEVDGLRWWQVEKAGGTVGWVVEGLINPDRDNAYERTLVALCPADDERIVYRMDDYVVTGGLDGSAPCVLDRLRYPGWIGFSHSFSYDQPFIVSPDGEYILYAEQLTQNDSRAFSVLYRLKQDGSERLTLTQDTGVDWAAWSADGQQIAIGNGHHIGIMQLDGSSFFVVPQGDFIRSWVTWLSDGETVVYAEGDTRQDGPIEYVFYRINILEGGLREISRTTRSM
jgi:hypothetical protein